MKMRLAAVLASAAALCACATIPQTRWQARADADLSADLSACAKEAARFDPQSPESYSGQYGAAAAMAGVLDQHSLQGGGRARMFDAVRDACMIRKGWKQAS